MKTFLITTIGLVIIAITCNAQSQWTTSGTNIYNSNTGNVGIGTSTPNVPLNIYGTGDVGLAIESSVNAPYLTFRKAGVNKWNVILERILHFMAWLLMI